jgi:hypothetical protein
MIFLIFRDPEPFDWYQRYSGVRDLINQVSHDIFTHVSIELILVSSILKEKMQFSCQAVEILV